MHLERLTVENFRAISSLDMVFDSGANFLVGPNAVGKTTLLEAIRLNKALLAPRTQQESRMVMVQLGMTSPHLPQMLNLAAIAGDPQKEIKINCSYKLSDAEIAVLPALVGPLARLVAAAQVGIPVLSETGQSQMIQFLGSPNGQEQLKIAELHVQDNVGITAQNKSCALHLTISPTTGGISGAKLFDQILFAIYESRLSPYKAIFSYFSADRSMPSGDIPIQLGTADAQQQIESHNSNPALKYTRLKSTLFASFIESEESRSEQNDNFRLIFRELLKEKEITEFSVNHFGQASIKVKDLRSGRIFDIDSLSSGEKGLILTFLIMAKAIERGGLVLIDEPEIHLNPAVCKELVGFMLKNYLKPLEIQAIVCTHSPEILTTAMRRDDCTVHHMRHGGAVSMIRKQDRPEVTEAWKLLGTSELEDMLYDAVVFVEGPDDVELLETAFPSLLSRVKFRELNGRGEIEKQIKKLQQAETRGQKESISFFLFDRDRKLSELASSAKVIVKQWDRYCLENYLIEPDILFDLLRREFSTSKTPENLGVATKRFYEIAKQQLKEIVIQEVYVSLALDNPNLQNKDRSGKTFEEAANALYSKIDKVRMQLSVVEEIRWKEQFITRCNEVLAQREQEWSSSWTSQCNGKQFIRDLYADCGITVHPLVFKRRLLQENKFAKDNNGTESWKLLAANLSELISKISQ